MPPKAQLIFETGQSNLRIAICIIKFEQKIIREYLYTDQPKPTHTTKAF